MKAEAGQHWVLVGKTGSGKTFFVRQLLARMHKSWPRTPILIVDSKRYDDFSEYRRYYHDSDDLPDSIPPLLVWRPTIDTPDMYEKAFARVLALRTPRLVVIDELSMIGGKDGQSYPVSFQRLMKVGRTLGITMIVLTQELANGPRQIIGQATHGLLFHMQNPYDVQKFWRSLAGDIAQIQPKTVHGFWYINTKTGMRTQYADALDFLR